MNVSFVGGQANDGQDSVDHWYGSSIYNWQFFQCHDITDLDGQYAQIGARKLVRYTIWPTSRHPAYARVERSISLNYGATLKP